MRSGMSVVMSVETRNHQDARCPRCGYDLHGVIESWKRECPIYGICSECGLEFEWGEFLSPQRAPERWCVEYVRWWKIAGSSFKTLLLIMFRPAKFWRELQMIYAPRWIRIPVIILPAAVILYLILSISVGAHVHNAYKRASAAGPITGYPPIIVSLYAAVNPFSKYYIIYTTTTSTGAGRTSATSQGTPRPRSILYNKLNDFRFIVKDSLRAVRYGGFFVPFRQGQDSVVFAHVLLMAGLCPLAFFALPRSLRAAKVRRAHILRIWGYSAGILVWPAALMVFSPIGPDILWQWWKESREFVIYGAGAGGLIIWWSLASKHYLKLPHAWGVGASMVVLAYLGGMFLVSFIDFLFMLLPE